jgi:ketosteroid isomerase-like protein
MTRLAWAGALGAIVSACGAGSLSSRDRATVEALGPVFRTSVMNQDWANLELVYADSAVLLPPGGPPVTGRDNIQVWFSGTGRRINTFETAAHDVDGRGDLAYLRGTYLVTFQAPGAPHLVTETGKFVWVLRKEPAGTWRVTVDVWNAD